MIDKRMLVDTVTIQKPTGETDVWGKVVYDEPTTLKPVRFDRQFNVSGSTNNRSESNPVFYSSIQNIAQWFLMKALKMA